MTMTEELARRILERSKYSRRVLPPAQQTELLMDWLEGQSYPKLAVKYGINLYQVGRIIKQARADAAKRLKAKGE